LELLRVSESTFGNTSCSSTNVSSPFIRLGDDIEFWCNLGFAYTPQLDFKAKESELFACNRVQPIKRCTVFVGETVSDPDDGYGMQSGRIGQQLPEVCVVGPFQLILDEHVMIVCYILAEDIRLTWKAWPSSESLPPRYGRSTC